MKKAGSFNPLVIVAVAIALAMVASLAFIFSSQPKVQYLQTAQFLNSQFVNGEYIEGFTPGAAEYGFSLEAISHLSFAKEIDSSPARKFLLESDTTFLFSEETGEIIPGLAGKFLYASKVTGADNESLTEKITQSLKEVVLPDGSLSSLTPSTFDYSWVILGLYAQDQKEVAATLAYKLSSLTRADGGFGFDDSEFTTASSTDATAMAVMALELTKDLDSSNVSGNQSAIEAALDYLDSTMVDGTHFVAFDAVDVNGTALALMAYQSATGLLNESVHTFLVGLIQTDGGIGSPWVENAGDRFATAQGYLALEGKSYLSLLGR